MSYERVSKQDKSGGVVRLPAPFPRPRKVAKINTINITNKFL